MFYCCEEIPWLQKLLLKGKFLIGSYWQIWVLVHYYHGGSMAADRHCAGELAESSISKRACWQKREWYWAWLGVLRLVNPPEVTHFLKNKTKKKQLYLLFHLRQYHSLMAKHSSTWAYWQVRNILICTTPRGLGDASLVEDIYSLVWFLRLEILFTCNSFYALWLHLKCELQISAPFFMTKNYCHNRLQVLWNCKLLCLMVVSCYVSWYFFITK